jgi:hypothetical protein
MQLVANYRSTLGGKSVSSYETVVRAALIIELRRTGYAAPLAKLAARFDEEKSPVFRLLLRLSDSLHINLVPDNIPALVVHILEVTLLYLRENNKIGELRDSEHELNRVAIALLRALLDNGYFSVPRPTLSNAVACCCYVLQSQGKVTLRDCVRANEIPEKACYRDYLKVKEFMRSAENACNIRPGIYNLSRLSELVEAKKSKDSVRDKIQALLV